MKALVAAETLHTVAEVAELWRCSDETIYRLIRDGRLRSCDIGTGRAKTRIPSSALTEFVQRRSRGETQARRPVRLPR